MADHAGDQRQRTIPRVRPSASNTRRGLHRPRGKPQPRHRKHGRLPHSMGEGSPGDVSADEHGTLMAMFAAAPANGWGMIGAAPSAVRIISVRVAQPGETGEGLGYFPAGITECLRYQQTYNIKVISLSLGSSSLESSPQATLNEQITVAHDYGIDVVAAAGNDSGSLQNPADDSTVLSVGAMNSAHELCGSQASARDYSRPVANWPPPTPAPAGRTATTVRVHPRQPRSQPVCSARYGPTGPNSPPMKPSSSSPAHLTGR